MRCDDKYFSTRSVRVDAAFTLVESMIALAVFVAGIAAVGSWAKFAYDLESRFWADSLVDYTVEKFVNDLSTRVNLDPLDPDFLNCETGGTITGTESSTTLNLQQYPNVDFTMDYTIEKASAGSLTAGIHKIDNDEAYALGTEGSMCRIDMTVKWAASGISKFKEITRYVAVDK